ncbi:MAG: hypothetical protein EZS28_050001, partial [Streblomastix strix]
YGGGIFVQVESGGKIIIDGQCKFIECKAGASGGGIRVNIYDANSLFTLEDDAQFENCTADDTQYVQGGGGISIHIYDQGFSIVNQVSFKNCNASFGGGIYLFIGSYIQVKQILNRTTFYNCEAQSQGGGMFAQVFHSNCILQLIGVVFEKCAAFGSYGRGGGISLDVRTGTLLLMYETCQYLNCSSGWLGGGCHILCFQTNNNVQITGQHEFDNCSSYVGGGMSIQIDDKGIIKINQSTFKDCQSRYLGGGINANLIDGTINIEDTTFSNCNCTQPGNGGALYLNQRSSSLISIINSSFINCKTISNSSNQSYGWGGAINIQTEITAENLNQQNFLMRDLIFIGCSAVNSIGNNIHIYTP